MSQQNLSHSDLCIRHFWLHWKPLEISDSFYCFTQCSVKYFFRWKENRTLRLWHLQQGWAFSLRRGGDDQSSRSAPVELLSQAAFFALWSPCCRWTNCSQKVLALRTSTSDSRERLPCRIRARTERCQPRETSLPVSQEGERSHLYLHCFDHKKS